VDVLRQAVPIVTLVFVVSSMIAVGLGLTVAEVVAPLRTVRLLVLSLVANFVAAPLLAILLTRILHLEEPFAVGLIVLGAAAGAPFLPKLAQNARGDMAFAVALMVLLMAVTVVYLPVVLPLVLPGVSVDPLQIARSLVVAMLLPLACALALRAAAPAWAARLKPWGDRISGVALVAVVVLLVVVNTRDVLAVIGTRAILAGVVFVAIAAAVGWFAGGPRAETRAVLATGTAQRNIAAALVVAGQNFSDPRVVVMVVVVAIVSLLVLMPLARTLGRWQRPVTGTRAA
jgi:bile acid:Na+ symporter, BASS family